MKEKFDPAKIKKSEKPKVFFKHLQLDSFELQKILDECRSLNNTSPSTKPESPPKQGCASVIAIGLVTVASLYLI